MEEVTGEEIKISPGEIVTQQTDNEKLGAAVDLSLLLLDPEGLSKFPDNILDIIGKVDAAKTIDDAFNQTLIHDESMKIKKKCP